MHQDVELLPTEDERVVLDEAFEFEIPCEVPSFDVGWDCGPAPAEWIAFRSVICSCGILIRLVCNDCKVKYQAMMANYAHISCAGCGDETHGFDRFEPLRSKS